VLSFFIHSSSSSSLLTSSPCPFSLRRRGYKKDYQLHNPLSLRRGVGVRKIFAKIINKCPFGNDLDQ
jgi:hypothetical protein